MAPAITSVAGGDYNATIVTLGVFCCCCCCFFIHPRLSGGLLPRDDVTLPHSSWDNPLAADTDELLRESTSPSTHKKPNLISSRSCWSCNRLFGWCQTKWAFWCLCTSLSTRYGWSRPRAPRGPREEQLNLERKLICFFSPWQDRHLLSRLLDMRPAAR